LNGNPGKLLCVDFNATWCVPCKEIGPVFHKLAEEFTGNVYAELDIDVCEETTESFDIQSLPTFLFFKDGVEVKRLKGSHPDQLKQIIVDLGASAGQAAKRQKTDDDAVRGANEGVCKGAPVFTMGPGTFAVPMTMHADNRKRLAEDMTKAGASGLILLQGGSEQMRNDSDHELLFRQESYFQWLFGVKEPEWFGAVDLATGKGHLFMPRIAKQLSAWIGRVVPPPEFKAMYAIDEIHYADELATFAKAYEGKTFHLLHGLNSDSGSYAKPASFDGIEAYTTDQKTLFPVLAESRVSKSPAELELMKYVSKVTSDAHVEVMRKAAPNQPEYMHEALFKHHIYVNGGCRNTAYTPICACGPSSAVLHYGHAGAPNARIMTKDDIALLDMGAEYHCYCSDITCSFPMSGTFSADQKMIYEGVLAAVKAVMDMMKPGTDWADCHRIAERTILEHLKAGGVVTGDIDEMLKNNLAGMFMPCGLGHFIGLDTHDVGGYLAGHPERITAKGPYGIKKLRTARILKESMCLTVEPGIYFVDDLMDLMLETPDQAKFLVKDRLAHFRGFGGVRIEDVVTVTATGIKNYTMTPRTCEEIESVMGGGQWPPEYDLASWLCRDWDTDIPTEKKAYKPSRASLMDMM